MAPLREGPARLRRSRLRDAEALPPSFSPAAKLSEDEGIGWGRTGAKTFRRGPGAEEARPDGLKARSKRLRPDPRQNGAGFAGGPGLSRSPAWDAVQPQG